MDVLTTRPLPLGEWLPVIGREYLDSFVPAGGAALKFAIVGDGAAATVAGPLEAMARAASMHCVRIDASHTRVHMMHELFFAITRALPWDALVQEYLERLFAKHAYDWPRPGEAMTMTELAASFGVAPALLARQRDQWLSAGIWDDRNLAQDFRSAMLRLCLQRLGAESAEGPVLPWLHGEKIPAPQLRQADISTRIGRTNARAMLVSLCHFIRKSGAAGLLLVLDLSQLSRPPAEGTQRYSPAAVMDTYEVLREMIDETEHLPGLFALVLAGEALATGDVRRAISQYPALQMRIWPDVRPGDRQNPVAPLVWLGP